MTIWVIKHNIEIKRERDETSHFWFKFQFQFRSVQFNTAEQLAHWLQINYLYRIIRWKLSNNITWLTQSNNQLKVYPMCNFKWPYFIMIRYEFCFGHCNDRNFPLFIVLYCWNFAQTNKTTLFDCLPLAIINNGNYQ